MGFLSTVKDDPLLDQDLYPEVIAAQTLSAAAIAEHTAAKNHCDQLNHLRREGDPIQQRRCALDLPDAIRAVHEKELEAKLAADRLAAARDQVSGRVQAAWRERAIPVVSELFDLLVKVARVHAQVEKLQEQRGAMTTATHGQLTKAGVADRISSVCRDLQMSPDRWLPLE